MLTEASRSPWLAAPDGGGRLPPETTRPEESRQPAPVTADCQYRPASFYQPVPDRSAAPPPPAAGGAVKKKPLWKGWNSLFRRRKAGSDSSSDEAATPRRQQAGSDASGSRQHRAGAAGAAAGSSGSEGGRRARRSAVKARVEARRSNTASSEEEESAPVQHVSNQLSVPLDGSLRRRSRAARTERYQRRRSRDGAGLQQPAPPLRPDAPRPAPRLAPAQNAWAATVVCRQGENGGSVTPPVRPRPIPHPPHTAAAQTSASLSALNGGDMQVASSSLVHLYDERFLHSGPHVPASHPPLVASVSSPAGWQGHRPLPPPPPPRDPRIRITMYPEQGAKCHSLDRLMTPDGSDLTSGAGRPAPSGPPLRVVQRLSGSDQSIAQYKRQLYPTPTRYPDQLGNFSPPATANARSRCPSQDSAFLSDPQTQPPAAPPKPNRSSEVHRTWDERAAAADGRPVPKLQPTAGWRLSSVSEPLASRSPNTSFSCADSDSVLGRSAAERRPLSMVTERPPERTPPPPRPASEQAQRRSENFEEALDELEAIYRSLRLDDDELLDRAERRDLPTPHQELWRASDTAPAADDVDEGVLNRTLSSGELSNASFGGSESRYRAPSRRRSAMPNKKEDDVFTRRLKRNEKNPNSNLLSDVLSQGGSYLLVSPVLSTTASTDSVQCESPLAGEREPHLTLDDVTFRNNRHANAVRIIDPQPPFGIPLGPTCPAAASDYLHVSPAQCQARPTFRPRKNPDLVADDLAFRALRKDEKTPIDTNALDALIRETDYIFKKHNLTDEMSLVAKSEAKQPSGRPVSLCICGGHSISDCELEEASATAAAARQARSVRLRPRPESQRSYGLYDLYVGNMSEPEGSGTTPSGRAGRRRPASLATSTETLTEAGQRRISGEFSAKVRPFVRVNSEPDGESERPVDGSRAATAPPSPARTGDNGQLDTLLEGLLLHQTPAKRDRHRPPRLSETVRALADMDAVAAPVTSSRCALTNSLRTGPATPVQIDLPPAVEPLQARTTGSQQVDTPSVVDVPQACRAPAQQMDSQQTVADRVSLLPSGGNAQKVNTPPAGEKPQASGATSQHEDACSVAMPTQPRSPSLRSSPAKQRKESSPGQSGQSPTDESAAVKSRLGESPPTESAPGESAAVKSRLSQSLPTESPAAKSPPGESAAAESPAVRPAPSGEEASVRPRVRPDSRPPSPELGCKEPLHSPDGLTVPLSPVSMMSSSRATPEGKSMTSGSDSERATERIVRYKEERRRQLAASAALQRLSSSDEEQEVGSAGGRSKLRRRREPRPPCGPAEGAADRGTPTEVRTTRASRLRAAVSGQNSGSLGTRQTPGSVMEPGPGAHITPVRGKSDGDSHDGQDCLERDKSRRRKSNLNRAQGVERAAADQSDGSSPLVGATAEAGELEDTGADRGRLSSGADRPPRSPTPELARAGRSALRRTLDAGTNFVQRRATAGGSSVPRLGRREPADSGMVRRAESSTSGTPSARGADQQRTGAAFSLRTEPPEVSPLRGSSIADRRTAAERTTAGSGHTASDNTTRTAKLSTDSETLQSQNKATNENDAFESTQPGIRRPTGAPRSVLTGSDEWSLRSRTERTTRPDNRLTGSTGLRRVGERDRPRSALPTRAGATPTRVNTDDISARIDKLTTMARATAERVDRLTGPAASGSDRTGRLQASSSGGSSDSSESKARRLASRFEAVASGKTAKPVGKPARTVGASPCKSTPSPSPSPSNDTEGAASRRSAHLPEVRGQRTTDTLSRFDSIAAAALSSEDSASSAPEERPTPVGASRTTALDKREVVNHKPSSESAGAKAAPSQPTGDRVTGSGAIGAGSTGSTAPFLRRPSAGSAPEGVPSSGIGRSDGHRRNGPSTDTGRPASVPAAAEPPPARPTRVIEELVIVSPPRKVTGVAAVRRTLESRATEQPVSRLGRLPSPVESRPPPVPTTEPPASPRPGDTARRGVPLRADGTGCRPPAAPPESPPPLPPTAPPSVSSEQRPPLPVSAARCGAHLSPDEDLPPMPPVRSNSLGGGSARPTSILKQRKQSQEERSERGFSPDTVRPGGPRPILKKKQRSPDEAEPRPILKKRASTDDELEVERDRPRPILKNKSVEDVGAPALDEDVLRPILKASRSREEDLDSSPEPPPSILKRRSFEEPAALMSVGLGATVRRAEPTDERPPRPILRRPPRDAEPAVRAAPRPLSSPAAVPPAADDDLQSALRAASPVPLAEAVNRALPPPAPPTPAGVSAPMTLEQKKNLFLEFENGRRGTGGRPGRSRQFARTRAERRSTQPITPDEVAAAAAAPPASEPPARRRSLEPETPKLSVAERARLYQEALAQVRAPPPPPVSRGRRPRTARFQTLPVTQDEVARARGTPQAPAPEPGALAASTGPSRARAGVKTPPRIGILKPDSSMAAGVSLSEPLAAGTGAIKKTPARSSRPSSPEENLRGILKPSSRPSSPEDKSRRILKPSSRPSSPEDKSRGILKPSSRPSSPEDKSRGILKPSSRPNSPEDKGRGILKPSSRPSSPEDKGRGILKPPSRPTSPEDKGRGILKPPSRPTSPEDKSRGILKPPSRPNSPEDKGRGILKPSSRPTSPEDKGRGILKPPSRPTSPEDKGRGILKPPSRPNSPEDKSRGILKPSSRPTSPDGRSSVRGILRPSSLERCSARTRAEDSSSDEDETCGVSLADQLFNLGPRHQTTSESGQTVEEIAAAISRRSRPAGASRRPRPAPVTLQKSSTEPAVPTGGDTTPPEIRRTGGIKDRLAALQKSGDEGWRRRVRPEPRDALAPTTGGVTLRKGAADPPPSGRPVSHIERLSDVLQETAAQGWKARVPQNDANRFTVAGKMGQPTSPCVSPALPRRQHNTPKAVVFRSKTGTPRAAKSMFVEPSQVSTPASSVVQRQNGSRQADEARPVSALVSVPELADASFSAFFDSSGASERTSVPPTSPDWDPEWDLDSVELRAPRLDAGPLSDRVRLRRRARSSRNPLRALSERIDVRLEYEEVRLGVGETHIKMAKLEELSRRSTFAQESLAGLAAKVDFSAVKLGGRQAGPGSWRPYRSDTMLLRVKGRRHVQTRLVPPNVQALNAGDCFVAVSNNEVIQWNGVYSNVIEQSKAADVALHVSRTHDLGCSASNPAAVEYDDRGGLKTSRRDESKFFQLLGGRGDVPAAGPPEEDEEYEAAVVATNKIYEVTPEEELVPVQEAWGQIPKYELLVEHKVLVFDFGAELYLWTGKRAGPALREAGKRLCQDLWAAGCDYSDCGVSPVDGCPLTGPRPDWGILGRVGQNMETILFREKFLDWNDPTRLIKVKPDNEGETSEVAPPLELAPCDAADMVAADHREPDLVLEMEHLGRGTEYFDKEAHRQLDISTISVKTWHVNESAATPLEPDSAALLHQGDTYVVQWVYQVTQTGRRLGGGASKHLCVGRQRCAYFFWQGASSTVNEKGASALMVIELDQERGPQVRVTQGREPAAFLQLFAGRLAILLGKREDGDRRTDGNRLLVVRGELPSEASLLEVACHPDSLRSRAALLLVVPRRARAFLWLGAALPAHGREVAAAAAEALPKAGPELVGELPPGSELKVTEIKQGAEPAEFWTALGGRPLPLPLPVGGSVPCTPRLFHFSCASGRFSCAAVPCLHCRAGPEWPCALPFTQRELYERPQPALLLLDDGHAVHVWQGWRPPADPEAGQPAALAGAARYRWHEERRCALQTALEYQRRMGRPTCSLVVAGLEPPAFQHLFPAWSVHTDAAELNREEGYSDGFERNAKDILAELTRSTYPLAMLMERPLPDGVDPVRLETYLSDQEFREVLKMEREEFDALPAWKKKELKKEADLF